MIENLRTDSTNVEREMNCNEKEVINNLVINATIDECNILLMW